MKKLCAILLAALSISCSAESGSRSQIVAEPFSNDKIEAQIDSIYHAMTLDERIAQMGSMRSNQLMEDGKLSLELCRKHIPHGIGHIAQFAISQDFTPEELRQFVADLQDYLVKHTRTGLPAIFHEEAITGFSTKGATTYPQQIGVSATWNPALVSLKSEYTRESMRSYGATMALSPMVDVVRSQHFNRVEEGYGEDGYLTSVLGDAFIRGLQGDDLRTGVATCTKHFLGYGGGISLPEKEVMEEIITPHEVGIKVSGNKSIMPGYHSFKDETAITNHYFIKELLRDYLAFDGVIVSDYFAIGIKWAAKGNPNHFIDRAEKALNAGADTELCDLEAFLNIPQLLKDGRVSEERIEEAVKSNLRMKARLGLLDANPVFMDDKALELDAPKYRQLAYDLASQGVVLLKNDGTLPLNTAKPKVALVGPNANSIWAMLGDYTYQAHHTFFQGKQADVEATKVYTLKEGLEQALGGEFKLSHERGCSWDGHERNKAEAGGDARIKNEKILAIEKMLEETSDPTSWSRAIKLAGKSDVVIAAMGEHILSCGEGRNRKGIRMPGEQEAFVEELIDSKTPVVVVLFGGRAQLLSEKIRNGAAAILHAWYPGEEGGRAVADILAGKVSPSGKLSQSYPATDAKQPLCYNYGSKMDGLVAYPFGYGLSYTTFTLDNVTATQEAKIGADNVTISLNVTNSGKMAGAEVVQLYIKPKSEGINIKPIQLKGFQRVELAAGESKRLTFEFLPELISLWEDGKWYVKPGDYEVVVATSSADHNFTLPLTITGNESVKDNREVFFSEASVSEI